MFGGQPLDGDQKFAFLTFDDGFSPVSTPLLLDELDELGVPATFFAKGNTATPDNAKLIQRVMASGHAIAMHSFNHNYSYLYPKGSGSADHVISDLDKTEAAYRDLFGDQLKLQVWRYPGGHMSWKNMKAADAALKDRGITWVDWDSTNGDAAGQTAPTTIQGQVDEVFKGWAAYGRPNTIVILMHDTPDKELTRKSLPSIVKALQDEGFVFGVLE
jgi:peptidoglycan/xylan/chitin deacetylase (PgdA/CDA1 family)